MFMTSVFEYPSPNTARLWSASVEVCDPVAKDGGDAKVVQFIPQLGGDECVEC